MNMTQIGAGYGKWLVYALLDEAGTCVYVGQTTNLFRRMMQHGNKGVAEVYFKPVSTYREALDLERFLIETLLPRWNRRYSDDGTRTYTAGTIAEMLDF